MLVLSRKPGQQIILGDGVVITVSGTSGGRVRLAIDAPPQIRILRGELFEQEKLQAQNRAATREVAEPALC